MLDTKIVKKLQLGVGAIAIKSRPLLTEHAEAKMSCSKGTRICDGYCAHFQFFFLIILTFFESLHMM